MRRTTPDLVGTRKTVYAYVSIGLMALSIGYVLWTNYVIFVGGNLPLTSISLGNGSTGAGLTMLLIGDLVLVMALWFVVDGVLLNLLHMVLRTGNPTPPPTLPADAAQGPSQQWQQPQGQWQPTPQGQWQPQAQWQPPGQPQQQWEPQPAQQGQWQQPGQPQQWQQPQPTQQQWQPSTPPPAGPPAPRDGGSQATLLAPQPQVNEGFGVNDAAPVHRRWTAPPST